MHLIPHCSWAGREGDFSGSWRRGKRDCPGGALPCSIEFGIMWSAVTLLFLGFLILFNSDSLMSRLMWARGVPTAVHSFQECLKSPRTLFWKSQNAMRQDCSWNGWCCWSLWPWYRGTEQWRSWDNVPAAGKEEAGGWLHLVSPGFLTAWRSKWP